MLSTSFVFYILICLSHISQDIVLFKHIYIQIKTRLYQKLSWHIKLTGGIFIIESSLGGGLLKDYIEERAVEIAQYIIDRKATVRDAARVFKTSKSTVHKDITERLMRINPPLAYSVKKVLNNNKAERHIRGGNATYLKYKMMNKK